MHAVALADLAATLSQFGPSFLVARPEVPSETTLRYWVASRSRQEAWHRAISKHRDATRSGDSKQIADWWKDNLAVLEEILISELLARVVAAIVGDGADESLEQDHQSLAAITHGVFISQLEASNRVSKLLLDGRGNSVQDTARLNRLRYGVERWTDWLIGRASVNLNRGLKFAISRDRADAFRRELRENTRSITNDPTTWLMNVAMREMLVRRTSDKAASPEANYQVASAALALFRPELFDDFGVPKSVWLRQLEKDPCKLKPLDFAIGHDEPTLDESLPRLTN
ncbi:MAG: hypothetical protein AAFU85_20835 [Planctomycetota bacterium]